MNKYYRKTNVSLQLIYFQKSASSLLLYVQGYSFGSLTESRPWAMDERLLHFL
ncbi:hypothetical protein FLBR109950_16095 [Flavobacterium branchiophilum]|uniref:hypothetical protein n=1 Tax=Flavobacterium branchiophilum TaxID=55197 RepID=UPI00030BA6D6